MTEESKLVPEEFTKVIKDFINDLKITFPEYDPLISKWWKEPENFSYIEEEEERKIAYDKSVTKSVKLLFEFCQKKLPPRFFDILYQNEDIFKEGTETDTEFLPKIHFKDLWQCEISQKTRDTIWKYLQLITFSIVGTINNKEAFGDTAKLFEAINEDEFKNKLQETLSQIEGIFDFSSNFYNFTEGLSGDGVGAGLDSSGPSSGGMPDAEKLHEHITGMLDGKLGQLAKEIAEETAENLNMDFEGATDMKDIFQSLLKNPTKLMGLVKSVGDKLDTKIKSGDLKESEIIAEATEMMNKMKNMPGLDNIQSLLSKMGMGNLGGKVNTGAMEANLNKKLKLAQTKERIRAKAEANAKAKLEQQILAQQQQQQLPTKPAVSEEEILKIFSTGEKIERTPRGNNNNPANKKKKGKK